MASWYCALILIIGGIVNLNAAPAIENLSPANEIENHETKILIQIPLQPDEISVDNVLKREAIQSASDKAGNEVIKAGDSVKVLDNVLKAGLPTPSKRELRFIEAVAAPTAEKSNPDNEILKRETAILTANENGAVKNTNSLEIIPIIGIEKGTGKSNKSQKRAPTTPEASLAVALSFPVNKVGSITNVKTGDKVVEGIKETGFLWTNKGKNLAKGLDEKYIKNLPTPGKRNVRVDEADTVLEAPTFGSANPANEILKALTPTAVDNKDTVKVVRGTLKDKSFSPTEEEASTDKALNTPIEVMSTASLA